MRCNLSQLAEITGMSVNTIKVWADDGMPCVSSPQSGGEWVFNTSDVFRYGVGRADAGKTDAAKEAKDRQLIAESGMKWLEYGKALEELVPKYKIAEHVEAGDAIVKSRLRAIAGRLAQSTSVETDPAVCQRIIQAEVDEALGELNKHWSQRG